MIMVLSLIIPIPGTCKNFNVHVLLDRYGTRTYGVLASSQGSRAGEKVGCND